MDSLKTWGGEKLIHVSGAGSPGNGDRPDKALIKAVARAFAWPEALESGKSQSISGLARANGYTDDHHTRRILKLAFLAPDIVEAILQGRQPQGVTLSHILQVDLPLSWHAQREALGFFTESSA